MPFKKVQYNGLLRDTVISQYQFKTWLCPSFGNVLMRVRFPLTLPYFISETWK